MKLKRIDAFCKEHKIARSKLLVRGALAIVNRQPEVKCNMCRNPSVGKFKVLIQDWNQGEVEVQKYLCPFHLKKAEAESEVEEL